MPSATLQAQHDQIEIRVFCASPTEQTFLIELALPDGSIVSSTKPVPIPYDDWLEISDATEYGTELFQWLFPDEIHRAFSLARLDSEQRPETGPLRLQLWLDPESEWLHNIWWEALYDPRRRRPLSVDVIFSRIVATESHSFSWPVAERPLRMILMTCNPAGLADHGCSDIDLTLEQALITEATGSQRHYLQVHPFQGPLSLDDMVARMNETQPHIVYLLAHAVYENENGYMLLGDSEGKATKVEFDRVAETLVRGAANPPRFIFLAVPQNADADFEHSLSALARKLVANGIPAVLAVQAALPAHTIEEFSRHFYAALIRSGMVDLALMLARGQAYDQNKNRISGSDGVGWGWGWSYPVLYVQMRSSPALYAPLGEEEERGLQELASHFKVR